MQCTPEEQAVLLQPLEARREQLFRDMEKVNAEMLQTLRQMKAIEGRLAMLTVAERRAA